MKTTSNHCDLCGKVLAATRENGWEGCFSLVRDGNGFIDPRIEKIKNICSTCGGKIQDTMISLKKDFKVVTSVVYEEEA